MKNRTINIVFAILSAVFGIVLIVFGIHEAGVDTDVANDENVIDTMMFIVPGIILLADSAVYVFRDRLFRTDRSFLLGNLAIVILTGFLAECIYFQFIHYGIHRPQLKMVVPAILISLVFGLFVLIVDGLYLCVRKAAGLSRK